MRAIPLATVWPACTVGGSHTRQLLGPIVVHMPMGRYDKGFRVWGEGVLAHVMGVVV